jgi:hypothetical protein
MSADFAFRRNSVLPVGLRLDYDNYRSPTLVNREDSRSFIRLRFSAGLLQFVIRGSLAFPLNDVVPD